MTTQTKKSRKKEVESYRGHLPVPRGTKFMGAIFEKYPEVQSITWDQYECLDGLFYVEPWSVLVNGKSTLSSASAQWSAQERAAAFELEGLILQALGEGPDEGVVDLTMPTAINTCNLLRAIFGNNVIVTLNRDGSIEREPSWGRVCEEDLAELAAEEEAQENAFRGHVSNCAQCKAAVHDDQQAMRVSEMCEPGRKLAQPFELGEFTDNALWERIHEDGPEASDDEIDAIRRKVGRELMFSRRGVEATPLARPAAA